MITQVTRALQPFHPLYRHLLPIPSSLAGLSLALLKATALEIAILAGHLILYPSGIIQERRAPAPRIPDEEGGATQLPTEAKPPVVLLHGFIDNRSVFLLLGRHIEEICERTDSDQVDIVGHSLGGLIARYYVQRLAGDSRVRTLVTLGTPHSGTRVAPLANAHPIVRQMRPGSAVIEELALPSPGCRTHFVSFWSDLDHLMDPLETACLEHPDLLAQNVRVSGIGHLALPVHPAVASGIRRALEDAYHSTPEGAQSATHDGGLTVA
jgi:pimeloyl-ACP methyl ester carboxylesterase